jgi:DNA-binding transcriptional LysR family regulator
MAAKTQQFDWDDARVLLALFRERTLRGAAQQLGVNASTIGRRLEALEQALAARLFDRNLDGVLPTAAAERLLAHAEQLEQAALGLAAAAEGFEREPEGVVRLSALPGIADHFVAPSLGRIHARYPRLRLELDSSIAYADLTRREADLALRIMRPTSGDLVAQKLSEDRDTILGSAAYIESLGTLRDFADARWLDWGHDLALLPSSQWLRARVPETAIVMRSSSINALLSAAEHGVGLVLLSSVFQRVRPLVEAKLSAALAEQAAELGTLELWLVGHRALRDVPRVAVVWDFIIEEIARVLETPARRRPSR